MKSSDKVFIASIMSVGLLFAIISVYLSIAGDIDSAIYYYVGFSTALISVCLYFTYMTYSRLMKITQKKTSEEQEGEEQDGEEERTQN